MILLISDINDKHTYNKLYEVSMQSNELEFQEFSFWNILSTYNHYIVLIVRV